MTFFKSHHVRETAESLLEPHRPQVTELPDKPVSYITKPRSLIVSSLTSRSLLFHASMFSCSGLTKRHVIFQHESENDDSIYIPPPLDPSPPSPSPSLHPFSFILINAILHCNFLSTLIKSALCPVKLFLSASWGNECFFYLQPLRVLFFFGIKGNKCIIICFISFVLLSFPFTFLSYLVFSSGSVLREAATGEEAFHSSL